MGTVDGPKMDVQVETRAHRPIIISITITQIVYFGDVLVNMLIRCFDRHRLQKGSTHNWATLQSNMLNKSNKHSIK